MFKKPTHFTKVSSSCIDLIFVLNTTYLSTGIEQSIYDKCHHYIFTRSSILIYVYQHLIIGKYGIVEKRTLKLNKKLFLSLTGICLSKIVKKLKYWIKRYWIYLIILFPIEFLNLTIKHWYRWKSRLYYSWGKDQNLLRNNTMTP